MRRAGNVQNVLGSFGRSRARRYQPSGDRVTFADVAGIDEAKEELSEVVASKSADPQTPASCLQHDSEKWVHFSEKDHAPPIS